MYTEKEVRNATLDYFNGDELATNAWISKYALKDKDSNLLELTPSDMHNRIAGEFLRIEGKYSNPLSYQEIFSLLENFKYFIPGGSPMYGIGNPHSISSLGNCFVLPSSVDSYGGIMKTDQEQVQLMKRRAGVGHDLSKLRPNKFPVTNAAGTSTGVVSFMSRFSNSTREVAQFGRRGALMLTINVSHPDSEEFITSKDDLSKITGANISVKVTDTFMEAVVNDDYYGLHFSEDESEYYCDRDEFDPDRVSESSIIWIEAKKLWEKIINQAWKNAEPGVLFWDRIIEESPADCYDNFKTISTNPLAN